ncbi:MAG: ATP synthase F1 subunit epsilon [Myxococcota bacterium]
MSEKKNFIKLIIVTPEESVIHSEVQSIILPGKNGYFEVLSGHTPFLTQLIPGIAIIKDENGIKELCISDGYASVHDDMVDVIVDATEWPDEIDEQRAIRLKEEATKRLSELARFDPEYNKWENRLKKAESRLELLSRFRGRTS